MKINNLFFNRQSWTQIKNKIYSIRYFAFPSKLLDYKLDWIKFVTKMFLSTSNKSGQETNQYHFY